MKIDSHQHFWHYDPHELDWIGPGMKVLKQDFLPDHLQPLLSEFSLDGSIAVQARQSLEETQFLLHLARKFPETVMGVVGWVDLCSPTVSDDLEALAGNDKLKGIRHIVQDEPDDDFMLREDFQSGISSLSSYGLTYDLLTFPRHLSRAAFLVERFPDQKFVLDHISKPPIKSGEISSWESDIRTLAQASNVWCKVSGMVTEADWNSWTPDQLHPYLDVVFDAFGPERLMFGSDWPVCLLSAGYAQVVDIVKDYVERNSPQSFDLIFGENCAKIYGVRY